MVYREAEEYFQEEQEYLQEAQEYLQEAAGRGSCLGLERIGALLAELGIPQDELKFVHIAGTNGKGSVLAYVSTVLTEAGYRVGRYSSPAVMDPMERIQVNGENICREQYARLALKVKAAEKATGMYSAHAEEGGSGATIFEIETAIAFLYFCEEHCDLVVIEAGLGGALDATNVVKNTVCAVFSSISRDHLGVLGNTIEEIAENKAGIIKPGCTVVSARQPDAVRAVMQKRAKECGKTAPDKYRLYWEAEPDKLLVEEESFRELRVSYKIHRHIVSHLTGAGQKENLPTALEVLDALRERGYAIPEEAVHRGIEKTRWPGRFTCLSEDPLLFIDGAHNEDAAKKLRATIEQTLSGYRLVLILGVFRDKEYEKICEILCPLAETVYTVDLPDKTRSLPAKELAETARRYCRDVRTGAGIREAVTEAMETAAEKEEAEKRTGTEKNSEMRRAVLACGSLSYLKEVSLAVKALL